MTPSGDGAIARSAASALRVWSTTAFALAGVLLVTFLVMMSLESRAAPWTVMAAAGMLTSIGLGLRFNAIASGAVGALSIAGWTAQLALTEPLWFGLIGPPSGKAGYVAAGVLALEALVAVFVIGRRWRAFRHGVGRIDGLTWLVLILLAAASCVTFSLHIGSGDYRGLAIQWVVRFALVGVQAATLAAVLLTLPYGALEGAARFISARLTLPGSDASQPRAWDRYVAYAAAGFALLVSLAFALLGFGTIAHLEDEAAYLFQANTFAHGALWNPAPPEAAQPALSFYLLTVEDGRWFSVTMPGWPAILSLGARIGAPWLVNPVLVGLSLLAAHALLKRVSDRGVANLSVVFMALSPWLQGIGGSLMPHAVTLAAALGAALALVVAMQKTTKLLPACGLTFIAGCLLGLTVVVRPQEGLVLGVIAGFWVLIRRDLARSIPAAFAFGLGCIAIGGLIVLWNIAMTGDPMTLVQSKYLDTAWAGGSNRFGFGPDIGPPERWGALDVFWPGHTPLEAVINAQHSLSELSIEMYGWSIGSLGLAVLALRWRRWRGLVAMLALISGLTIVAHLFYWHTAGYYVGPRYWFMLFAPVAVLSALGVGALAQRLSSDPASVHRIGVALVVLALQGIVVSAWRMSEHFPGYNGSDRAYLTLSQRPDLKNALIFVHANADNALTAVTGFTDPALRADKPIFVRPLGAAQDARTAAAFPDRKPMYLTHSDAGYVIHEGLPPH